MGNAAKLETPPSLLNVDKIQSIRQLSEPGDTEDFFTSLAQIFFDRAPNLLEKIDEAINEKSNRGLETSAHALKGSCGNIGALYMAEICSVLEENGRNKVQTGNRELYEELKDVYILTKAELEKDWMK